MMGVEDGVHVQFMTAEARKAMKAMADMVTVDKLTEPNHLWDASNDASTYFFKRDVVDALPRTMGHGYRKKDFGLDNFSYAAMPSFSGSSRAFAAESGWRCL